MTGWLVCVLVQCCHCLLVSPLVAPLVSPRVQRGALRPAPQAGSLLCLGSSAFPTSQPMIDGLLIFGGCCSLPALAPELCRSSSGATSSTCSGHLVPRCFQHTFSLKSCSVDKRHEGSWSAHVARLAGEPSPGRAHDNAAHA